MMKGDALETLLEWRGKAAKFDLIATDPPYSFSGQGAEHEMTATVAIVLRESAHFLKPGSWMLVMCASSWRSTAYMVEALRGALVPARIGTWCKPEARTKARTAGWKWASVNVVAFRSGKARQPRYTEYLDHITAAPVMNGRRAQLPPAVADWMVTPYAVEGGTLFDPFAGSGEILRAGERAGMTSIGVEKVPVE
jgi:DNA modification methylase